MDAIVECVPNFSEGRRPWVIRKIVNVIKRTPDVYLLDVNVSKSANRTVVTFIGSPEGVKEAAFRAIERAAELIDMRRHKGEHPRLGATDVCPFIPIMGVSMDECVRIAREVGRGGYYFDMVEELKPLYNAKSPRDVEKYIPPKPHEGRVRGLGKIAKRYMDDGYAVVMDAFTGGIWELAEWLHGLSNSLKNLVLNPELMEAILDLTLEIHKSFWGAILNEVGDYVHIVLYGDDYGLQTGPQMPPRLWERFIFPRLKELVGFIKKNSRAKFMLHCCGGIRPLIGKIIEAGVDILNPIQPRAKGMNRKELREEFGGRIIFHGGIDIQYVLPRGAVKEVEEEVIDTIRTFAPLYIFSPAHNIQADVPPQNIVTAYRTAITYNPFAK